MTDAPDLIDRLLAMWSSPRILEIPPPQLARQLLELVELRLEEGRPENVSNETWRTYLDVTSQPRFLLSLGVRDLRYRWAETTFAVIRRLGFNLLDMFEQRRQAQPDRALLQETDEQGTRLWSYERIHWRLQTIAAVFYNSCPTPPRIAILAQNGVESACCDLACLFYDIFVTPLNVHFDANTLVSVFNRLGINGVVTDSEQHRRRLSEAAAKVNQPFRVFLIEHGVRPKQAAESLLREACARLGPEEAAAVLSRRPRRNLDDPATVMLTSGSTGVPKGIVFTEYNLVTKRFARGAALPRVGDNETLLCYLPLYHTFGRYLELLGTIYWGGTYVFAGNPSVETLIARMRQVQPTGMIGIPFRWMQLRDHCLEEMGQAVAVGQQEAIFRRIVGERLHWGLSAAGFLDPKVFHFFHRHGVDLCSGFGMTEATGGITMSPTGEYFDNTVGIPLPGVKTRFSEAGELQVAGPYIARYLDGPALPPAPQDQEGEQWLPTGDLFRVHPNGHLEIVDRLKDVYKNNKGQTIAPRRVEQKFAEVPGIKRTFLVGDGRGYNVLLIVPDTADPIVHGEPFSENAREYFRQIVTAVNRDLAAFERVVNFAVVDRDFELDSGELTPKGSFRRKIIEEHFSDVVRELYRSDFVDLATEGLKVRIPRWLFRDLGILEDDIVVQPGRLHNRRLKHVLPVERRCDSHTVLVGDLEYQVEGDEIDLGLWARQPRLWIGNPALIAFCPCRDGWDLPLKLVAPQVLLPWRETPAGAATSSFELPFVPDEGLAEVNQLCVQALFAARDAAVAAVEKLAEVLVEADNRTSGVIQRRLEALARHPLLELRCLSYRTLLLDEPIQEYHLTFPAFIQSGLPFLSEGCIESIAQAKLETRRLEALRQRLRAYRTQLSWPADEPTRRQFRTLLNLLVNYARYHPEAFSTVREELACWVLHRSDPELAEAAEQYFDELTQSCRERLEHEDMDGVPWDDIVVFEDGLSSGEVDLLKQVLFGTSVLKQSVMLAFDEPGFDVRQVPPGGVWVTRVVARHQHVRYRASVNTLTGRHFDLQLVLREDLDEAPVRETMFWTMALGGHAYGPPVAPRFGCYRPELGAMSLSYVSDLTAWERIREFTSMGPARIARAAVNDWRKLFIRAIATVFRAWRYGDCRIVPGAVTPSNIVVPEPDFRQGSCVLSLTGWTPYRDTLSLVGPLIQNFYQYTAAHYPWTREYLDLSWIFDSCVEALGVDQAKDFLRRLRQDSKEASLFAASEQLQARLEEYLARLDEAYYVPLPLGCAVDRFIEWRWATPQATAPAREQTVTELCRLYRFDRFPEIARYYFYRHTYFAEHGPEVLAAFGSLLDAMFRQPDIPPTQMVELSDLQAALRDSFDRGVFSRMVFPRAQAAQRLEIATVGDSEHKHVIVRSYISDKQGGCYTVREPFDASEIGQLYRLFFTADFPKIVSEQDRYLVCTDSEEQIVGGMCYQLQEDDVVNLDAVVVTHSLRGRGIGGAMLDDFALRMASRNAKVVKTHFFLRQFCLPRGFRVDRRWGGLVRILAPLEESSAEGSL